METITEFFAVILWLINKKKLDFPGDPVVKNLPCNAGDLG